jgi:hypothetical protein
LLKNKDDGTLLVQTQGDNQLSTTKAFLKALKIPFENLKDGDVPYNLAFVAKIEKSLKQAEEGKVVKIALNDIWK